MTMDDILNINTVYFSDLKESIKLISKGERYALYVDFNELDPFHVFINPLYKQEIIEINGLEINFLYLKKDTIYTLKFINNSINRMIKLSRATLNSKITISNKNIELNSNNLYYKLEENYKGDLILNVKNDNAIIEFLFKQEENEIEILDFPTRKFQLNKKYNILSIPKEYKEKNITIELNRNAFKTNFIIYLSYSIPPYNYFSIDNEENIITIDEKYSFLLNEHYKGDINLMTDEYYCVMIENFGQNVLMTITVEGEIGEILKIWKMSLILLALLF